jgi:HD-GYP domain-containing protein (c-di-GMP phosphodiesterase class II)
MAFQKLHIESTEQTPTGPASPRGGQESEALVPIALKTLCPTMALDFDLYLKVNARSTAVLHRERSTPFTRRDIDRLLEVGVHTLYVPLADHISYRRYLQDEVARNEDVPPAERYRVLKKLSRRVFDDAMGGRSTDRLVEFANTHVSQLTNILCDRDLVLADLFSLMDHDYYTYTHATNVCAYCLVLADGLGISDQTDLVAIGIAALLHDLGKRRIPSAVLNKPGKLDPEEWNLVQKHPGDAFDELAPRGDMNWDQLMMVYQHHERLDGSGYPVGLGGAEIHAWGRVCAIADVFDALTSERPYRKPDSIDNVWDYLERMAGRMFDKEMVERWITITKQHRFPTLSHV